MSGLVVRAVGEAIEDAALQHLGRDLGTIHRDDIARAAIEAMPVRYVEVTLAGRTYRAVPTSCRCGGSWAWAWLRPDGAHVMQGCVCHTRLDAGATARPDTTPLDRVRRYCDDRAGLDGATPVTDSQLEPNLTMADLRTVLRMASEGVR